MRCSTLLEKAASKRFSTLLLTVKDKLALGSRDAVFGPVEKGLVEDVEVRSYGSLPELDVPFVASCRVKMADKPLNEDALEALLANI